MDFTQARANSSAPPNPAAPAGDTVAHANSEARQNYVPFQGVSHSLADSRGAGGGIAAERDPLVIS